VRQWDIVFGRFPLTHRWNFDQVPLALVLDMGPTTVKRGTRRVQRRGTISAVTKHVKMRQNAAYRSGPVGTPYIPLTGTRMCHTRARLCVGSVHQPTAPCAATTAVEYMPLRSLPRRGTISAVTKHVKMRQNAAYRSGPIGTPYPSPTLLQHSSRSGTKLGGPAACPARSRGQLVPPHTAPRTGVRHTAVPPTPPALTGARAIAEVALPACKEGPR
jgi:hypothetical protein